MDSRTNDHALSDTLAHETPPSTPLAAAPSNEAPGQSSPEPATAPAPAFPPVVIMLISGPQDGDLTSAARQPRHHRA